MAFHADIEVEVQSTVNAKIVPLQYLFSGTKLDLAQGVVSIASIGRDADGVEHPLRSSCPQANVQCEISSLIGRSFAGVPVEQILAALGELADELYAAAAQG